MSAPTGKGLDTCFCIKRSCLLQMVKLVRFVFASSSSCLLEMAKFFKNDFRQALIESSPNGRDLETFCIELMTSLSCRFRVPPPRISRDVTALDPGPPSSLPTDPDTKVDIASLTWEDKERVLRLLFAKINNVQVLQHATCTYVCVT